MKVAYLLGEFPSLSETFILREIRELQRQGVEVRLFALRRGSARRVHAEAAGLMAQVDYWPRGRDPRSWEALAYWLSRRPGPLGRMVGRIFRETWSRPSRLLSCLHHLLAGAYFARQIQDQGLPHIHAHWAFMPALVAWLAAELSGRSFSFSAHAWDLFQETPLLRQKIAHAAWVVTCSEFNRRYLERQYPEVAPGKVWVAYHGLDFREWAAAPEQEGDAGGPPEAPPLLLSVGRLQPKKGFPYLLEACALLQARGVPFRSVIVGEGPEWDRLQQLRRERCLSATVELVGALTQAELRPLYAAARAFVLPCVVTPEGDRDGLPNVILEALAMGVPVVTTPVSAIPEVIVDGVTGLLVPPGDAVALAQALERVLTDSALRQRLGQQGRSRVRERFDIARNVQPLVQRFKQAARTG